MSATRLVVWQLRVSKDTMGKELVVHDVERGEGTSYNSCGSCNKLWKGMCNLFKGKVEVAYQTTHRLEDCKQAEGLAVRTKETREKAEAEEKKAEEKKKGKRRMVTQ
jgi:hypothetical protein